MRRSTLFLSMFLLAGGMAFAQQQADVPRVISYQGLLTSSDGNPLPDGEYPVTITMYGDEHGSQPVWHDTYTAVVRGGVFNIYLGSGNNPLPAPDRMNKALWIGTQIAGAGELRPLTRLSATPYAINVPDNAITNAKLADGAVTADKVDMDYISGVTVNGKNIAGKGAVLNIQGGKDIDVNYDDATQSIVIGSPASRDAGDARDKHNGDREMLGTQMDAWTLQGDGVNIPGAVVTIPAAGDWIGTSAAAGIPFELRTNGTQIMVYNQTAAASTPNVVGGGGANSVGPAAMGNVIAGGGGISGGANTIVGDRFNTISGGDGHTIQNQFTSNSVISGGGANTIGTAASQASFAVIAGGSNNNVSSDFSSIGGGIGNSVFAPFGVLGGGSGNQVLGPFSTVAGGQNNVASLNNSSVGGGFNNQVQAPDGTIGGGRDNQVFGPAGTVAGGQNNSVFSNNSGIGGGFGNQAQGPYGSISGGQSNIIGPIDYASIGGGLNNSVQATRGTVAGGESNAVSADLAVIGGGFSNGITGILGAILGGDQNRVNSDRSVIGGGRGNTIGPNGPLSVIGGGEVNTILADRSVIGGGSGNNISGPRGVIGGGEQNSITLNNSVIGGGFNNISNAPYSVIGGGFVNRNDGIESVIGGGINNLLQPGTTRGVIGGGSSNQILSNLGRGVAATISGGERLTAQSYGQVVMGVGNIARGNLAVGGVPNNDPILIIGNGTAGGSSNAFEVSYNGHSTVYHNLGAALPVYLGSTYIDNVIYSWGEVTPAGGRGCDFGVQTVTRMGAGWYRIRMNLQTSTGGAANLSCASVTATLNSNAAPGTTAINSCRFIRTSRIGAGNIFDVYISQQVLAGGVLSCVGVDDGFVFKVVGRP